jgi:molybdopterin/thiamine biosynthesis adenylyltransferase
MNPLFAPTLPASDTNGDRANPRDDGWSYADAFSRNLGLINPAEQERLRRSRVAIAGMGGVGGIDLVTLARLGIGRFTIADPDVFEVANTNRQYGATRSTEGRSKAQVMAEIVRDINPEADLRVYREPITAANAADFLRDADLFVDALEVFEIGMRRRLFALAADQGIHGITAGPAGFGAVWLVFSPTGMSFDRYFDLSDDLSAVERVAAFIVGVAPAGTQRTYMDMQALNLRDRVGPSSSLACHIAAGVMACEAVKVLLQRGRIRAAPYYQQFDPFVGRFVQRRLGGGNRGIWQRFKRRRLTKFLDKNVNSLP